MLHHTVGALLAAPLHTLAYFPTDWMACNHDNDLNFIGAIDGSEQQFALSAILSNARLRLPATGCVFYNHLHV